MERINFFVEKRRKDKLSLLDMIKKNPDLDLETVIALFSKKTGLKFNTIRTYIDEMSAAGDLE